MDYCHDSPETMAAYDLYASGARPGEVETGPQVVHHHHHHREQRRTTSINTDRKRVHSQAQRRSDARADVQGPPTDLVDALMDELLPDEPLFSSQEEDSDGDRDREQTGCRLNPFAPPPPPIDLDDDDWGQPSADDEWDFFQERRSLPGHTEQNALWMKFFMIMRNKLGLSIFSQAVEMQDHYNKKFKGLHNNHEWTLRSIRNTIYSHTPWSSEKAEIERVIRKVMDLTKGAMRRFDGTNFYGDSHAIARYQGLVRTRLSVRRAQ